jgi:hypothetical protein
VAAAADFVAVVFFVDSPVTPFRIVPITVRFVVVDLVPVAFLTTVAVLPSLDSLIPLILRRVLELAAFVAVPATARRVRVAVVVVPEELELVVDEVVVFLVAAARVDLAFSTMLVRRFEAAPARVGAAFFVGDAGFAMSDFVGDAGRSRGAARAFEDVGDRI